jgi:predicted nucleic acid-binding protein
LTAFTDTTVIVCHLTDDPPEMAARAAAAHTGAGDLLLADLVVAEIIYVLESFCEVERVRVAQLLRSVIGFGRVRTVDPALLMRVIEISDRQDRLLRGLSRRQRRGDRRLQYPVVDRSIDRVQTASRIEP